MSTKLDEMWAALEAHKPNPEYADAWQRMLKERTVASVWAAYDAAPKRAAVKNAVVTVAAAVAWAAVPEAADHYAQEAIDEIKEVKP